MLALKITLAAGKILPNQSIPILALRGEQSAKAKFFRSRLRLLPAQAVRQILANFKE
jgi:hypothetical protein